MKAATEAAQTRGDMQDDFDFKAQSPLMMAREQEDIHPFRAVFTKLVSVTRERDALRAENERLREALELMVEMVEMNGFGRAYALDVAHSALAKENSNLAQQGGE